MRNIALVTTGIIIGAILAVTSSAMAKPGDDLDVSVMDTMRTDGKVTILTSHILGSTGCANGGTITVSINELPEAHVHIVCGGANYWSYTVSNDEVAKLDIKIPPR